MGGPGSGPRKGSGRTVTGPKHLGKFTTFQKSRAKSMGVKSVGKRTVPRLIKGNGKLIISRR